MAACHCRQNMAWRIFDAGSIIKSMPDIKKVLVVEDEHPMAQALLLKLAHSGFKATVAENGAQALEMAEKTPFDLIILDIVLPRMDGFTVLKNLRAKKIMTPVIVLSNLSQTEDIARAKALGVQDYFIKTDEIGRASCRERV